MENENERIIGELRARSMRVSLDFAEGMRIGVARPTGMQDEDVRRLLVMFGPLSAMVLTSLREFGLPARRAELEDLRQKVMREAYGYSGDGSFFLRPEGISSELATISVFQWRKPRSSSQVRV